MAKTYIVSKAFQSTDKDTKEPQVVKTQGGDMHKFMVQVENQPYPGWMSILKKIGNKVEVGDELYGVIDTNQWDKPQFTSIQRPVGMAYPAKKTESAPKTDGELGVKLDYLISLFENFLESQGVKTASQTVDVSNKDNDDVDLSELPY